MNENINNKKVTNKELAKRFNITEQTYNNWKKNKPELIKIIELGLSLENTLEFYYNENYFHNFNKKLK